MSELENCMHVDVKAPGCPATRRATGPSGTAWCRAGAARTPASYSVGTVLYCTVLYCTAWCRAGAARTHASYSVGRSKRVKTTFAKFGVVESWRRTLLGMPVAYDLCVSNLIPCLPSTY